MSDKKLTDSEIIKALEHKKEDMVCAVCNGKTTHFVTNGDVLSLINHLQAENERLKDDNKFLQDNRWKELSFVKAEAYKEFAERLKMRAINRYNEYENQEFPYATIRHIDELLKEMVGDK